MKVILNKLFCIRQFGLLHAVPTLFNLDLQVYLFIYFGLHYEYL